MFGLAGDPTASNLMQTAKVFAGELQHAAEAVLGDAKKLTGLAESAAALEGADFSENAKVKEAEKLIADLKSATTAAEASKEAWDEVHGAASAGSGENSTAAEQYYPVMYFVDKEFKMVPSTCGGNTIGSPISAASKNSTAAEQYYPVMYFVDKE